MTERHDVTIHKAANRIDSHTLQMRDMQRHVEDLDNRGRRRNLRVRGLPEAIEGEQIAPTVTGIFNGLLNRPPPTPIDMERIHRALRPKGRETDPPEGHHLLYNRLQTEGRNYQTSKKQTSNSP